MFSLPEIYPITDTGVSGVSHAEQVEMLIAGGAKFIQLREKHASPREFYESAAVAIDIANSHGVRIIINDRVDIALALNAAGVHLGQDDLPPEQARAILGDDAIIGYSTRTIEEASAAMSLPIDYLAFGPIFPTRTKRNANVAVGISVLREVRKAVGDYPLAAIGGINEELLPSVFLAGANSAAMISALISDVPAIADRFRKLTKMYQTNC